MIRVCSDGLSLCTDMVRIGNSVEKLHGSLIRMGYHPYKLEDFSSLQGWGAGVERAPVFRPEMNRTPPYAMNLNIL